MRAAVTTENKVVSLMDELVNRLKVIQDLNLPSDEGRTLGAQIKWLRENRSQMELLALMHRGYKALDTFSHEDPEWDVLADQLDAIFYALDEESRP